MTDVVLTVPVQVGEESQRFGHYLNQFMESRSFEAERMAMSSDAPYMMVRSDPLDGQELKVLTFQETSVASAFSSGWPKTQRGTRSHL